jgi:hypothetical protein
MFLNFDKFLPRHAPFVERKYGAAWYVEDFPAFDPDNKDEVNEVWRAYLEQTVLLQNWCQFEPIWASWVPA